jgi:dTDP-glucose 4,6-dehydratase
MIFSVIDNERRSRRVLLAGGAGFIGSHLCDALLARGDSVMVVDNLCTGRRRNLSQSDGNERFLFRQIDVVDPNALASVVAAEGPFDVVCNLASPASPDAFASMPLEIMDVGSTGMRNLLEVAERSHARFLYTSTSEVYGDPLVHPQPESYFGNVSSIGPRSCYDESKRFGEALAMAMHRHRGVDIGIVRVFNTYGERMAPDDGRVVTNFVRQAVAGEPLALYGHGSRTRSFCHVDDLVRGLIAMIDSELTGPVNLGNPHEVTIRELADAVIRLTGSSSDVVVVELPDERDGDPERRCPDIAIARLGLGWEPTVSLDEGLGRMIDHFRRHEGLDAEVSS